MDKESLLLEGTAAMHEEASALTLGTINTKEKCGICCTPVTTRGVLDCCSHVYCFSCIDSWSAITNFCPLCRLQFKFITFITAADNETLGEYCNQGDFFDFIGEDRDQWGDANEEDGSLSFPSYFIDEDAVVCLDGDGCRVRVGLVADHGESGFEDTSVACDSCDCWYHAMCVGYKAESQNRGSWLCPRCAGTGVLDLFDSQFSFHSNLPSSERSPSLFKPANDNNYLEGGCAVTVIDAGETAVVVSMDPADGLSDNGNALPVLASSHLCGSPIEVKPSELEMESHKIEVEPSEQELDSSTSFLRSTLLQSSEAVSNRSDSGIKVSQNTPALKGDIDKDMNQERTDGKLETSCSSHVSLTLCPAVLAASNNTLVSDVESHPSHTIRQFSETFHDDPVPKSEHEVVHGDVLLDSFDTKLEMATDKETGHAVQKEESSVNMRQGEPQGICGSEIKCAKRKLRSEDRGFSTIKKLQSPVKVRRHNLSKRSPNKNVGPQSGEELTEEELVHPIVTNSIMQGGFPEAKLETNMHEPSKTKGGSLDELKQLVQGPLRIQKNKSLPYATSTKENKHTNEGVRTRKIVHRGSDLEGKTSVIVDQVRRHLKEATGPGASNNLGEVNVTDAKFIAAFKAAVVSSQVGMRQYPALKQRPTIPGKGVSNKDGVRQSLAQKLYGASGKRRQAWDRDWDIAFWKERASNEKKARHQATKMQTDLALEMALLKKAIGDSKESSKVEVDSLLSRIYPADTSLFPRQDDVKPLAEQLSCKRNLVPAKQTENAGNTKPEKGATQQFKVANTGNIPALGRKASDSASISKESDPRGLSTFVNGCQDLKADKRKWALEVLARKNATGAKGSVLREEKLAQDGLPLLAELPSQMRPVLEYDRRSKVPTATRQAANLKSVEENPECKAAISSAVCKEVAIYDRANTKGVYVNLCVQTLSSNVENEVNVTTGSTEQNTVEASSTEAPQVIQDEDMAVIRAWTEAGLISDSPSEMSPAAVCKEAAIYDRANTEDVYVNLCVQTLSSSVVKVTMDLTEQSTVEASTTEAPQVIQDEDMAVIRAWTEAGLISASPSESAPHEESPNGLCAETSLFDLENNPSLDICRDCELNHDPEAKENDCSSVKQNFESVTHYHNDAEVVSEVLLATTANNIPCQLLPSNTMLACNELYGTERKGGVSDGLTAVEASQVVKRIDKERDVGDSFIPRKKESPSSEKGMEEPGTGLGHSIGAENKNTSEITPKTGGSGECQIEATMESIAANHIEKQTECHDSIIPSVSSEPHCSAVDTNLQEPPSISVREAEKGTFDEAPHTSVSMEAIWKQVEKYVKEHIRPLHKSHVITSEQYRWAVTKTTNKVMQHHTQARSAYFLIREGEKVKRLAEQYLESFKQAENVGFN